MLKKYFITIEDSCDQDWSEMTPNEMGRHCAKCSKTVIDFSGLSDDDIIKQIERSKGNRLCGQFDPSQLNHFISKTNIRTTHPKIYKLLLSLLLISSSSTIAAQETKHKHRIVQTDKYPLIKYDEQVIQKKTFKSNSKPIVKVLKPIAIEVTQTMRRMVLGAVSVHITNIPLYVIDGIAVDGIPDIKALNIKSVEVLKDAAATAIYGARGANGVIIITTNKPECNNFL